MLWSGQVLLLALTNLTTTSTQTTFANLTIGALHAEDGYACLFLPSSATGLKPHLQVRRTDVATPSIFLGAATENIITLDV